MHVLVIGAGVVGVNCAYLLLKKALRSPWLIVISSRLKRPAMPMGASLATTMLHRWRRRGYLVTCLNGYSIHGRRYDFIRARTGSSGAG